MENTMVRARLAALREEMTRRGVDACLVLTDDFHASEYVDAFFRCRAWLSGFTGSAGTLLVFGDWAGLWTDGRYFLQAASQLEGTGIELMKMGEPGVPTVLSYLKQHLASGQRLAYDGRTVTGDYADSLKRNLAPGVDVLETEDLVGEIWSDRPPFPAHPIWELSVADCGKSRAEKLADLRREMAAAGAERFLLASLDDIAWLYNLRGDDVECNPVFMSYTLVDEAAAVLYLAVEAVPDDVKEALAADGVSLRPYLQVYEDLKALPQESTLLLSRARVNTALLAAIPGGVRLIDRANPTTLAKALKNPVEQEHIRQAHIQDGVAVTRLIRWLEQIQQTPAYENNEITELDVAEKLYELRSQRPGFLGLSFGSIIASGPHGAIIHYGPTQESNIPLVHDTFLLMDTGGQYRQGTTDITRTVVMGEVTQEQKEHFTAVLRGNLDLAAARFKAGVTGANLDLLARAPLWELGLDYNHGTGHGVGYLLNVHEGPQNISLRPAANLAAFAEGMLTSDEPGVYLPGKYGIRTENLMLCVADQETEFGKFLRFETVTMVPYDRRAILPERLSPAELEQLNAYHAKVYQVLSPWLDEDEQAWLKEKTAAI